MSLSRAAYLFLACILATFSFTLNANAKFINWHSTNVQILKGWDYEVGEEGRTIITLEHANGWKYGDFFMFIDSTRFDPGKTTAYGEFSPRFSLSKITGKDLSYGIVKDVLISTMLEKGKGPIKTYLYGGAVDLNLPGFKFFKTNLYLRDNPNIQNDETWQVTVAWNRPFEIANQKLLFEGFADFIGQEGSTYRSNQMVVPRLLLDIGHAMGKKDGKFYGGVEYQHWRNKLGIKGKNEDVPQLQFKWVF
jgi:nucleoside-specific outer membrane channel protein Tsx